ncbi:BON domain-containing protein [Methylophilus aquaticus]|uniref:BON domain-containing protein n=1 Tax=Methylophilus aquaticus TaxID=1971610 RepID=A0ABT9JV13_9PROT|nr:BON domain-containing protein [Methylophilus aquaticus]MDP8568299.1 BON domain-containing protein [Methylophilus aquaticus]
MKKINHYVVGFTMIAALMSVNTDVLAASDAQYHFLPTDTVVSNVKTTLESHGIDASTITIDSDTEGVVKLSGEVASKQQADIVARLAMHSEGVYAVLGDLRYDSQTDGNSNVSATVPSGIDPVMEHTPAEADTTQLN